MARKTKRIFIQLCFEFTGDLMTVEAKDANPSPVKGKKRQARASEARPVEGKKRKQRKG